MVENVCQRLLEYNLHKERTGSNRFAKVCVCVFIYTHTCVCVCVCEKGFSSGLQGMSETFSTLHGLVNKGVNVVMDIPYELWNETSAEVADLKKQVI